MSTETTNKKIKIDNGTTFGRTYTDKAVDERLQGLVSTATFTPVKEKANNSLQKPAGLTKTKLVGVGTNGQENIEIGDNLTLANGKLSATGGGSGGDAFDIITLSDDYETYTGTISGTKPILLSERGVLMLGKSRVAGNQAMVDLISADSLSVSQLMLSNGKIDYTNYRMQGLLYSHFITLTSNTLGEINFNYITSEKEVFTIETFTGHFSGNRLVCSGFINNGGTRKIAQFIDGVNDKLMVWFYDLSDGSKNTIIIDNTFSISDRTVPLY